MGGLRLKICGRGIVPGEIPLLFFTWGGWGEGCLSAVTAWGAPCLGAGRSVERTCR